MKVRILAAASRDLLQGHAFYEKQKAGLGDYFLDSLFSDIDSISLTGGIHVICFGRYRRLLSKRFPFAVYYRVEKGNALVYAVLDCRRRPAWIRKRLG